MRRQALPTAATILAAAAVTLGAAPAPRPAPAATATAAAASAPAAANDPKGAVLTFMRAMFAGDETAIFNSIVLANDDARKEAQAVLGEALAEQKWSETLQAVFKTEGAPVTGKDLPADLAKAIADATVTVAGDAAQVVVNPGPTISVARDQGVWKVDFLKTQRAMEGPYNKDVVDAAAARLQIQTEMIAAVKAGKFATAAEASAELAQRLSKVIEPKGRDADAKRLAAIIDIQNLKNALGIFEVDNGRFPTTDEGLGALLIAPPDLKKDWHGPYLDKMPLDPWGHAYIYRMPGTDDPTSYGLSSMGADGKPGTGDDITTTTEK